MNQGFRRAAIGIPGFCAFLILYAPQSILPLLAQEFAATPADISLTMTATALAIAMTAPFAGAIADVLGRKRVIVAAMLLLTLPTAMLAFAPSLNALIGWRFVQGLVLPPVFTVVVAYIGEEWPASEATGVTGVYMAATSFGGFSGRFFSGLLADTVGWRNGFLAIAAITFISGLAVAAILPRERNFVRSEGVLVSARQMLGHWATRVCSRSTRSASAPCSISSRCSPMWASCWQPRRSTCRRPCSARSSSPTLSAPSWCSGSAGPSRTSGVVR